MAIRQEKKKLLFRDDVLMVIAFGGCAILRWQSTKNPNWSDILDPLSYVLGTIGILILYGMMAMRRSRREAEKRRKNLL